jgi:hypothetical protein
MEVSYLVSWTQVGYSLSLLLLCFLHSVTMLKILCFMKLFHSPCYFVDYEKINPVKFVPALVDGDLVVSDSFAIILVSSNCSRHLLSL